MADGNLLFIGSELLTLIEVAKDVRHQVAHTRFLGNRQRYPEVGEAEVTPLTTTELIRVAMKREIAFQEQVLRDMGKTNG